MEQTTLFDGRVLNHHPDAVCKGQSCPLHNPSNHALRQYGLNWREDWGVMTRVVDGQDVVDPDEYKIQRLRPGQTLILRNSAKCGECQEEVVSTFRWDFASCSCGCLSVDGGKNYLKRVFDGNTPYEDTSIVYTKEK